METRALHHVSERNEVLEDLYREHYPALVRLAFLLTSDQGLAEDLVQEAFARTWRSWRRIRRDTSVPAYLRITVVNLARSSLRRRVLELRHRERLQRDSQVQVSGDLEDEETANRIDLARAISRLPIRKRACIVLRYYADLSEQETADFLSVSVGTVKSQTSKALFTLERLMNRNTRD